MKPIFIPGTAAVGGPGLTKACKRRLPAAPDARRYALRSQRRALHEDGHSEGSDMNKRIFLQGILCMSVIGRATEIAAQTSVDSALERYRRLQGAILKSRRLDYTERDVHITSPRLRAHVVEVGRGEPLLVIHGGNGVGAHWLPLMARLPGRRLIVPDRPGCGLTDGFIYDGVDMRSHGVGFVEGVLDALHVERTSIIGNSMGGYYALCFALAHPDRVHKLILAGGPAFSAGYQPMSAEAIEARVKGSRQPGRAGLGALMADPGRCRTICWSCSTPP